MKPLLGCWMAYTYSYICIKSCCMRIFCWVMFLILATILATSLVRWTATLIPPHLYYGWGRWWVTLIGMTFYSEASIFLLGLASSLFELIFKEISLFFKDECFFQYTFLTRYSFFKGVITFDVEYHFKSYFLKLPLVFCFSRAKPFLQGEAKVLCQ